MSQTAIFAMRETGAYDIPPRTQKALEKNIAKGGAELYEAHQLILTLVRRNTTVQRYSQALNVLYTYALKLEEVCVAGVLDVRILSL